MQGLLVEPFAALVTHKLVNPYGHVVCTFWATMRVVHFDAQDPLHLSWGRAPNAGSSLPNQQHLYRASPCETGAQSMDGLMKGKQRGTPASSSSNITPTFLSITTWVKLFIMFVQQTTFVPICPRLRKINVATK